MTGQLLLTLPFPLAPGIVSLEATVPDMQGPACPGAHVPCKQSHAGLAPGGMMPSQGIPSSTS